MISSEKAQAFLSAKESDQFLKNKIKALSKLNKKQQRLGLVLLREIEAYKEVIGDYTSNKESKRRAELFSLFEVEKKGVCAWEMHYPKVLSAIFGDVAPYVLFAWKNLPTLMYQTGYGRRSFRAPDSPALFVERKIDWLQGLVNEFKYDFDLATYAQYNGYTQSYWQSSISHVYAAAIEIDDEQGRAVKKVITDTIYGKDPIGKISRSIIKALLLTSKDENYMIVEKLLLSAQRQEGLRQTILETLDETHINAQKYLIKVVLEHNLLRFSSVVRALDVWCGMGWEAAKVAALKRSLQLGHDYLNEPERIDEALKSQDNLAIYMALWASGCVSMEATIPRIKQLLERTEAEKQATALLFLSQIDIPDVQMELALPFLTGKSLLVTTFAFQNIAVSTKTDNSEIIRTLLDLWERIGAKEYVVEGKIFSWTHFELTRQGIMSSAISMSQHKHFSLFEPYFEQMEVRNRSSFAQRFLRRKTRLDAEQRAFAFVVLTDRAEWVRNIAFLVLEKIQLSPNEAIEVEKLLTRKSADLRKGVLSLLAKQKEKEVLASTERLLSAGGLQQRLGGLDLLNQLHKNKTNPKAIQSLVRAYEQRKKLTDKESVLLSNLHADNEAYNEANGFGLYRPDKLTVSPAPTYQLKSRNLIKKLTKANPYDVDLKKLTSVLEDILKLLDANKNHEYTVENWDATHTKMLIGSATIHRPYVYNNTKKPLTPRQILEQLPLAEVWENWYKKSGLTPKELWFFGVIVPPTQDHRMPNYPAFLKSILATFKPTIPHEIFKTKSYQNLWSAINIIGVLSDVYPFEERIDSSLKITESILSHIPKSKWVLNPKEDNYNNWRNTSLISNWMQSIRSATKEMNAQQLSKTWHLSNWYIQAAKLGKSDYRWPIGIDLNIAAYRQSIINEDDLTKSILHNLSDLNDLTTQDKRRKSKHQEDSKVMEIVSNCVNRILDVELKRGDTPTSLTAQSTRVQHFLGIDRLIEILSVLKKEKLHKGYVYYWSDKVSKKQSFSHLLRVSHPKPEETFTDFSAEMTKANITEQRILEVAMYAPQWLPMVQELLGWKKLTDAVWWLHAHTKESGYTADDKWSSDVSKYTSLTPIELADGAVDVRWFKEIYKGLKKARWEKVYTAAKYISTGPGYRRAQIFADAMLGNFKVKALIAEVEDKRNQDKVRALGLIPLNKRNPEGDILKRYKVLQRFLKVSKQFGSQRQVSEKAAVKIAMDNLARTANYPDPIRLSWAMEALEAQEILSKSKPFVEKEVEVALQVNDMGIAYLKVTKSGKTLKAIPAKLRKHKTILQLKAHQKTLKEQYRRTRKALEEAMCRGDQFQLSEIDNLFLHPVVAPQLKKLVFAQTDEDETIVGYYESKQLVVPDKEVFALSEEVELRIAHCTDLYQSGDWSALQSDCFRHKRVQPFKQIFRELYLPTHDELAEVTTSRRYAGHQVQTQKTVALLKTRGWTVDYDDGLRKIYHKENLIVNLFAIADWFTPSDIEAPTLETISFTDRNTHKLVPFNEISPLIFSEVMRDIDLVVSVAHAGGVDPEASHSTLEMRIVMAEETSLLLGLENVAIKGSHLIIKGSLSDYSIHLGSGVVHKMPGGYLSILPVHSSHRGRIFLPFADDDPKTSEILSKMLLLAEDNKIQDPTVLRQL